MVDAAPSKYVKFYDATAFQEAFGSSNSPEAPGVARSSGIRLVDLQVNSTKVAGRRPAAHSSERFVNSSTAFQLALQPGSWSLG